MVTEFSKEDNRASNKKKYAQIYRRKNFHVKGKLEHAEWKGSKCLKKIIEYGH